MSTEEQLNLFAADSHVNHSALPGSEKAQKMTAHSGRKCCESYARFSPLGSLAKTLLESSQWNSTRCYLTWSAKVTPAKRLLFQLAPSMHRTDEIESGLLHTPTATANQLSPSMNSGWWPTPNAGLGERGSSVKMAIKALKGEKRASGATIQKDLGAMVKLWPTPTAHISKEGGYPSEYSRNTPSLTSLATQADQKPQQSGSLNPAWVEWLMGFPIGHTDLSLSETQSFRELSRKSRKR